MSFIDEELEDEVKQQKNADDTESESDEEDDLISQIVGHKSPTRITLKLHVTDKTSSSWDSVSLFCFRLRKTFLTCEFFF